MWIYDEEIHDGLLTFTFLNNQDVLHLHQLHSDAGENQILMVWGSLWTESVVSHKGLIQLHHCVYILQLMHN